MYAVKMEDLTGLGGPMGTERTSPLGTYYFNRISSIRPFLCAKFPKLSTHFRFPKRVRIGYYDCSSIGFRVSKIKMED